MTRTYWYKIRQTGILDHDSVQGWQTTHDEEYVLDELKSLYAGRLAYVCYEENGKRVVIYSDL